jgi:ParB-like chromosome segregation protein Spo0J
MKPNLSDSLKDAIKEAYHNVEQKQEFLNELRAFIFDEISPRKSQPIDNVKWVPIEQVQANDYNPNSVAKNEMRLLYVSISHDGYTQPVVTIWDEELQKYVIVDGFHRYTTMRLNKDLREINGGYLPIVVIDKDINDRMAATIRHNRARGKHSVAGMGQIVFKMLQNGATDEEICAEVGLEPEELVRLKYVTGFAKLFSEVEYNQAYETDRQLKIKQDWRKANPDE